MEILVLGRSLNSSILSSASFQLDKTFWGVWSAAVEQSRLKAQGGGKIGSEADPRIPPRKKKILGFFYIWFRPEILIRIYIISLV